MGKTIEEIYGCNVLIRYHFNSPEQIYFTDFSLYESHNLVGLDFYEKRAPTFSEKQLDGQILLTDAIVLTHKKRRGKHYWTWRFI